MQAQLQHLFSTLIEFEQLKKVIRKGKPVGLERYENSAEHSWHVALAALLCAEFSTTPIDINEVVNMLRPLHKNSFHSFLCRSKKWSVGEGSKINRL